MRLRHLIAFLTLASLPTVHLWGQPPVAISPFPSSPMPSQIFIYSGSNMIYQCISRPNGPWNGISVPAQFSWTRAANTLTSIANSSTTGTVTTSTAHGLRPGNPVVVSGATVDTDLNGSYVVQTVGSTTTFTITTANVSSSTFTESTLVVTTTAPRSTVAIWTIQRFLYDGSNNLVGTQWANGAATDYTKICDSAATYSYR